MSSILGYPNMYLGIQQLMELEESHKDYLPDGGMSEITEW